jgi:hypothetical protein
MSGLKKESGKPQAEREASCQRRRAAHKAMPTDKRWAHYLDATNLTLQGGFGGNFHASKRHAEDDRFSPEARALFREAVDWGYAAFAAEKAGKQDLAAHFAGKAGVAATTAMQTVALGWVGDAEESK